MGMIIVDKVVPRTHTRAARTQLVLIALLFLAPLLAAWVWYANIDAWRPTQLINHGDLISPARPLPDFSLVALDGATIDARFLHGKWTLVYIGSSECDNACHVNLDKVSRVRLALGKDMMRVQTLYVLTDTERVASLRPRLTPYEPVTVAALGSHGAPFMQQFETVVGGSVAAAGRVYMIDPLGNLMMSYGTASVARDLLQDLERLLKISRVG